MPEKIKQKKTRCYQRLKRNKTLIQLKLEWIELDLTTKLVLIIGVVLLLELILAVFLYPAKDDAINDLSINIVFRTALSSVIGYIIGGMNHADKDQLPSISQMPTISKEKDSNSTVTPKEPLDLEFEVDKESLKSAANIRAFSATVICLVSIVTLFTASYFSQLEYREGLIQLRDLISTTIGFLIANHHNN